LIHSFIKSYKQLPLHLYQINLKFRDEMRPRFGVIRGREFLMKDGYSFHSSKEDLRREFNVMEETYTRIFTRLGLEFRVVEADSGAIGGSGSKEFMVLAQSGEDTICVCNKCKYAANLEAAKRIKKTSSTPPPQADFAKFHTPNTTTIESLADFFKVDSFWTIKAIVKKVLFKEGESALVFFFIRGCDTLNVTKALNAIKGANDIIEASEEEIREVGLYPGYIGAYALRNITQSPYIYFDKELEDAKNLIMGANEEGYHFVGVDLSLCEGLEFKDLIEVKEGDLCPKCGDSQKGELYFTQGIEIGHIFQLGDKYSSAFEAFFLDETGKSKPFLMGCYGIGVSRLLGAIIEQHYDDRGMQWSKAIAPFTLDIIVSNTKDSYQMEYATTLYETLQERGIECIFDDREERYGVKMADFELIGIPYAVIVGKGLNEGNIEFIQRKNLLKEKLNMGDAIEKILEEVRR
ncbi:MAG: proline--tRNA ligase, partial [Helicobacter sp.]|nr:proline--tRNA ligase [Helicobacter sp.]